MKKLLLLLFLPLAAFAQVSLPDSARQSPATNFTPQFNYSGTNAATSKIQMYNPLIGKYFGIYSAFQQSNIFAQISGTSAAVAGIPQLINYSGTGTVVSVKDTLRGGEFAYNSATMYVDSGITFPATGKGSGTWVRLGANAVASAAWYGVTKTGTMNGLKLNNATHSPYVSVLNINFPNDTIAVEMPIYIRNRTDFTLNNHTTLKHPNEVPYTITTTAAPGATTIYIADADKKFLVNQTIGLYSTSAPIVGTEAGENWPRMSASRINAVFSDRVVLDSAIRDGYNTDSAAVAYNVSNLIVVENAKNVVINSPKLDGNKANAFYGYPMTRQTESDIANNGISVIGSTDVAINNSDIINTNLNGMKWTRNNYRVYATGGEIKNPNGKGIVANYGGGDLYVKSMLLDSSRYNDGLNFNGDINGYTLNNVYVEDVRTRRNGRWGVRAQGSQTRMYIKGLTSNNDGGVVQTEGADSKITQLTWHSPQDFRCGCNTVEAAVRIGGARTIIDGFSADSIGVPADMFRFEIANFKVMNGFISNMPSAVSSGKTIYRGLAGATNGQILNITYDNVDQTKIMKNTAGGPYFGDLTTSGVTVSMSDRPNFSGSTTARNRFGNYTAGTGITVTDNTSTVAIDQTAALTWSSGLVASGTTFPIDIERSSGSVGWRIKRTSTELYSMFVGSSNDLTFRTGAAGNIFTIPAASNVLTFTTGPFAPTAAAGTNTTQLATTAHVFAERSNSFSLTNKTIAAGSNTITGLTNTNLSGSAGISDANISSAATWNAKQSAITFGTGVQTALGVNIGSAGAPVLFNGDLGTPSSAGAINSTTDGATFDAMGVQTITRTKPTGDWAYSGFTNTGRVAWGKGIAANNRLIWGTGPLRGTSATIDTIKMSLSTSGDLVVNGKFKSQHLAGVVNTDSIAGINSDGNLVRFAPDAFAPTASPALTGTPTAPTAAAGTTNTQIATTQFVVYQSGRQYRYTASGDGVSTTISTPHGLTGITTGSSVIIQPMNLATAGVLYATVDTTNVNLTYAVAPANGTDNLEFTASIAP